MIGQCEELPCSVQLDIEENFLRLEKCVKFMNGDGHMDETAELITKRKDRLQWNSKSETWELGALLGFYYY